MKCKICKDEFDTPQGLRVHKARMHKSTPSETKSNHFDFDKMIYEMIHEHMGEILDEMLEDKLEERIKDVIRDSISCEIEVI